MHQPPPDEVYIASQINVNSAQLQAVDNSTHLGSTLSQHQNRRLGDVATGFRRRGNQVRLYKDTLKTSLKRLQINPANWEDLARAQPTWRRAVKTGAAIFEATRITAAKAKREARKFQLPPPRNANAQPPPTCPRYRRTFRAQIGLIGHLRTNCSTQATQPDVPPVRLCFVSRPAIKTDHTPEPPQSSSSTASIFTATTPAPTATALNPNKPTNSNLTTAKTRDVDSVHTCPHCDRIFTPHIGLVGRLRIHRTETGEPEPRSTCIRRNRLNCYHCVRIFTHRLCVSTRAELTAASEHLAHTAHPHA
nr:unnamed protein product [Spirometra erinaceieuropaei]